MTDEETKRLRMVQDLMPHSTVVVCTPGLVYHLQRMIEDVHGGAFRRNTRVVLVNNRGDSAKVRGEERVFFDPACDKSTGSNVADAEIRKARDIVRVLNVMFNEQLEHAVKTTRDGGTYEHRRYKVSNFDA